MAVAGVVLQLLDAIDRDDVRRALPSEVDLHQQVGPAGEDRRVRAAGEVLEHIVDVAGYVDAHAGIITRMTALGGGELGGPTDIERELAESRAREAALAEVLGLMRSAPGELSVVLEAVLEAVCNTHVHGFSVGIDVTAFRNALDAADLFRCGFARSSPTSVDGALAMSASPR